MLQSIGVKQLLIFPTDFLFSARSEMPMASSTQSVSNRHRKWWM